MKKTNENAPIDLESERIGRLLEEYVKSGIRATQKMFATIDRLYIFQYLDDDKSYPVFECIGCDGEVDFLEKHRDEDSRLVLGYDPKRLEFSILSSKIKDRIFGSGIRKVSGEVIHGLIGANNLVLSHFFFFPSLTHPDCFLLYLPCNWDDDLEQKYLAGEFDARINSLNAALDAHFGSTRPSPGLTGK